MPLLPQRWVIVGGEDKGGILVREGQELASTKCEKRLSTGAVVEELSLIGERLHFRRLTGTGPTEGWISVFLEHKDLAQRVPAPSDGPVPPKEAPKSTVEFRVPHPAPARGPDAAPPASADLHPAPLALGDVESTEAHAPAESVAENSTGESADAGGQPWSQPEAGVPEDYSSWREEANEPRPPPRFESEPASKIPPDAGHDLKWLVWNEIWRVVNNKLGSIADGEKKKERFSQAEKDEERCCAHLRRSLEVNVFSNSTVLQVKRQASQAGHAVANGHVKGVWLPAARCDALEAPKEMEAELWTGLVKAVRLCAVTIFFMAKENFIKATAFQRDFEVAWKEIEEATEPDPY